MSAMTEAWAAWVDERLAERGWTRYRLAKEIGVSPPTVGRWGTLDEPPRPETLRAVATALDEPMVDVLVAAGILTADDVSGGSFHAAVRDDPNLTDEGRRALRAVHKALTGS